MRRDAVGIENVRDGGSDSDALTVVLVHGFLGGSEQWTELARGLADKRRIVSVDLPGFGRASADRSPPSIGGYADHLLAELDRLAVDRFSLLGHSMGGMIAQEVARRTNGRVERLVLYGTGPLGRMPDRFEPLEVSLARLEKDGLQATARRIIATWFLHGEVHPGFDILNRIGSAADAGAARSALQAMSVWDGRENLRDLDMPTLVLWGDRDRSYRWPQTEALWRGIPEASLAVIPEASHAAHLEKPEIFMAILKDYLGS